MINSIRAKVVAQSSFPPRGEILSNDEKESDMSSRPTVAASGLAQTLDRPLSEASASARPRLDAVDLLRGLVMVLMALDHTRDFFGTGGLNPRDVHDPALFLTRWITHFCAPVFIFLAGASAWLYGNRGRSVGEVSRYLLTRGFWLMLIEFTVVRLAWMFSLDVSFFFTGVIWAIGASMVVLAALVYLPRWAIAATAIAVIAGHNLLDGLSAEHLGAVGWLWKVLRQSGMNQVGPDMMFYVLYTLVPWAGVMAAGYALGPVLALDQVARRRVLVRLGLALTAGFIVLRATNLYGDPAAWTMQSTWLATVLSFINCEKYPASLLYLMMTLGPALFLLAVLADARGRLGNWITTFGRVPFLYYVAHLYLIHLLAVVYALAIFGDAFAIIGLRMMNKPPGYGLSLPGNYAVWLLVVVSLYPLCRWFAALKHRRRDWWWSYL
jgi:uncharacterized membrane protein